MGRDVLRTSRSLLLGIRRPCPCRSSVTARLAALRARSRLCTWTHPRPFSAPFIPNVRTLTRQSGADSLPPFLRPSSRQANMPLACLHLPRGCSSLRTISAGGVQGCQWHACFPPSGTRSLRRTDRPRALPVTGNGCPLAWVYSCAVHVATDTCN